METYAGFSEHTDNEIGRLYSAVEEVGQTDNTLFIYIVGDNGASAEGQMNGAYNEMSFFNGAPESTADMLKHYDEWGSASTYAFSCRLGGCYGFTFLLYETSCVRLWRYAQRHGYPLAQGH